ESAVAVAGEDPDLSAVRHEDGDIEGLAGSMEVARDHRAGLGIESEAVVGGGGQGRLRVGEAALAVVGQDGEAVAAAVDDEKIVASGAGEVASDQADRLLQAGDRRSGGGGVQAVQSRAGTEAINLCEGVMSVVQEDADIAAALVADGNVGQAVAVEVRHGDVGGC